MKTIDDYNFAGKKALIRVDFNVPLNDQFEITDDTRMTAAIPTIQKILNDGGSVVLISHLGRPKNGPEDKFSLVHLKSHLYELLNREVKFVDDCVGKKVEQTISGLEDGEVLLLENLRFYSEETAGDIDFSRTLAKNGDIYVNDAFGTAHRAHASTAIIAQFFEGQKCFGYIMAREIENVSRVLKSQEKPVTAIIGGAKVSSKITIINNLMPVVDHIIIGGGMAYTFAAARGGQTGDSLVEKDYLNTVEEIYKAAEEQNVSIHIPTDSLNANAFDNDASREITPIDSIPSGWMGLDIGPESIENFKKVVAESKVVLWNGPLGVFEMENFSTGTREIGEAIAQATARGTFSLVGGGDSVAAAKKFGIDTKVSYVSTGGGAMLEYLEGKTLPGIAAILD
jgi:phosphoglycerate kinase